MKYLSCEPPGHPRLAMRLEGHEISGCFTLVAVPIAGLIIFI